MSRATANGIGIEYEISGSGPPLLLIMGLGGQLCDWHPGFVEGLEQHFSVIRFDNRDSGLTTYADAPLPSKWQVVKASVFPSRSSAPYQLTTMADDAAGLLDAIGIESAHVAGMSMGGMIAQRLTIQHPNKVASLCSIMSNTGDRRHGRPTPKVLAAMARRGRPERSEVVDVTVEFFRLVGGPDWDENEQRRRTTVSTARAYNPAGVMRQTLAIAATSDRTASLKKLTQPTLVMHGLDDPLVRPSGGRATAAAVPGSRLLLFPGMGHDLPATRHHEMIDAIERNTRRTA